MESAKSHHVQPTETQLAFARSLIIWIRLDGVSAEFVAARLAESERAKDAHVEMATAKLTAFMGRCAEAEHDADQLAAAIQAVRGDIHSIGMEEVVEKAEEVHQKALGWRDGTASNALRAKIAELQQKLDDSAEDWAFCGLDPSKAAEPLAKLEKYRTEARDAIARVQLLKGLLKTCSGCLDERYLAATGRDESLHAEIAEALNGGIALISSHDLLRTV